MFGIHQGYRVKFVLLFFAMLFAIATDELIAQESPSVPASDDEVLLVLPKSFFANRDQLAELRSKLNADPTNPELAAAVANRYLALGNQTGDPRFYGYARAAIDRWWESDALAEVLKTRAKLKEKDHLYDEALADLDAALKRTPDDAQVLIEIANINRVKGNYKRAFEIGDQLEAMSGAGAVPAALARAPAMAQTGKATEAYELLSEVLPAAEKDFPSTTQYIRTLRAEIAAVLGREKEIEEHYVAGLAANDSDYYVLRGYGDLLLDQKQPGKALELLKPHTNDTGVLLRAAIAAKQSGDTESAQQWTKELENRFEEIRLRGGQPHGRFESRLVLELKDDPKGALVIALQNWEKQKEVRDTRNVLEAAIAAGDPAAAQPVVDFLRSNDNQHVLLRRLVEQLESLK